ncbi:MAG: hypothetical protein LBR64_06440 [Dysgonamonadaceae bacterium]|jgi:hypothetical protein|nr:hypothetical protein [Dysgonamonadaceae bacterium]
MNFRQEIEDCLEQIRVLNDKFRQAGDSETIPATFFSDSEEILNRLKSGLNRLKTEQAKSLPATQPAFFGDKIVRKIYSDFGQSITLNHRFMFLRDIFGGDARAMDGAVQKINDFNSVKETLDYLDSQFPISWESEAGRAFMELLNQRFT